MKNVKLPLHAILIHKGDANSIEVPHCDKKGCPFRFQDRRLTILCYIASHPNWKPVQHLHQSQLPERERPVHTPDQSNLPRADCRRMKECHQTDSQKDQMVRLHPSVLSLPCGTRRDTLFPKRGAASASPARPASHSPLQRLRTPRPEMPDERSARCPPSDSTDPAARPG